MPTTNEILDNVVWLVNALDDEALNDVQDLPFLEMAQAITISRPLQKSSGAVQSPCKRVPPRYPTSMRNVKTVRMHRLEKTNERRLTL